VFLGDEDTTLFAHWSINYFTITFKVNGGKSVSPQEYEYDEAISLPKTEKNSFKFGGWFLDSGFNTPMTLTRMPDDDLTLYAKWDRLYKITFKLEGGSCDEEYISLTTGDTFDDLPEATKDGHTFEGWYTSSDGGIKIEEGVTPFSEDITSIFAHWKVNQYNLAFRTYYETVIPTQKLDYDAYITLPTVERDDGYTLDGWYLDEDYSIPMTLTNMPARDLTLHAKWIGLYMIRFNPLGGICDTESIGLKHNSKYGRLPEATKDGYTFEGWFTEEGVAVTENSLFTEECDITLNAHWKIRQFTISFNVNGLAPQVYSFDELLDLPQPERESYTFLGWYLDPDFNEPMTLIKMPARDLPLYAKWSTTYKVTIKLSGGICDEQVLNMTLDSTFGHLPEATRIGHEFEGWFTEAEGGVKIEEDTPFTGDIGAIYAHWKINQYNIVFKTYYEIVIPPSKVDYDSYINVPQVERNDGYTLDGWYLDEDYTTPMTLTNMPANDLTLHAKWSRLFKIVFNTLGGSCDTESFTRKQNERYGTLPEATREGYDHKGWFDYEGTPVTENDYFTGDSDIVLYAHWNVKHFAVVFNTNGGSQLDPMIVDFGGVLNLPTELNKDGYTFDGWFLDESLEQPMNMTNMPARDITLYAKWTQIDKPVDSGVVIASVICGAAVLLGLIYLVLACFCSACAYHALLGRFNLFNKCACGQQLLKKIMPEPEPADACQLDDLYSSGVMESPSAPPTF